MDRDLNDVEKLARLKRPRKEFTYRRLSEEESETADKFIIDADHRIRKHMRTVSRRLGYISQFDQVCQFTLAAHMYRDQHEPTLNFKESLSNVLDCIETPGGWQFRNKFNAILSRHMYRFAQDEYEWFRSIGSKCKSAKELRNGNVSSKTWVRQRTEEYDDNSTKPWLDAGEEEHLRRTRFCLAQAIIELSASNATLGAVAEFLVYGAETHETCLMQTPEWSARDNATIGNYCSIHSISRKVFAKRRLDAICSIKSWYQKIEADYTGDIAN